jgi:MraZ protein
MFTGRHFHFMDNKGRVSIPSRYREILQERKDRQIVITNFQQNIQGATPNRIRYILAFPASEWEKLLEKWSEHDEFPNPQRNFQRFIVNGAEECPLDRQGRILIPPNLRDYAQLSREVCVVGMMRRFEIWDKAAYEAHWKQLEEFADEDMLDAAMKSSRRPDAGA